ncbi:MAG TPA: alkene reductase [Pyrinomonadaceae bacterium]|nr:alkene reductase [Pyrinomonadaceae bacterium]
MGRKINHNASLLSPVMLGDYELANRMVMSPLTRSRAGLGLAPTEMNATYYAQRASAGLIVTEATHVTPQGIGYPNTPGVGTPEQIAGWRLVTDAVHGAGGKIFLQLWHVGRISHPLMQEGGALPVAPSAIPAEGELITYEGMKPFVAPRALETDEIQGVIGYFRTGAQNALDAGFDGIEIHGANGYLLDQFLEDSTNKRSDGYGGSIKNRARLLLEVVEAVTRIWGAGKVGVRLSPAGTFNSMKDSNPSATFGYVAEKLGQLNLAYLHIIEPADKEAYKVDGAVVSATKHLGDLFGGTVITAQGYDYETGNAVIARGDADLVAFGKLFIANPDLPLRFRLRAPLNEPDSSTFYGGDVRGYTDYPALELQTASAG